MFNSPLFVETTTETGYGIVLMQCRQSVIQIKSITENKSVRSLNLCRNKWCSKDQRCSNGILNRVGPWTTSGTPLKFLQKLRVRLCVAIRAHERHLELSQLSYTLPTFKRKRLEKVVCQVLGRKYDCIARRTKGEIRKKSS